MKYALLKHRPRMIEKREQFIRLANIGLPYQLIDAALGICHATSVVWRYEYKDQIIPRKCGRKPKVKAAAVTNG
jgi:hypothetical protein